MPKKRATRSKKRKGFNMDGTERKAGSGGVRVGAGRPKGAKNKSTKGVMLREMMLEAGIDPNQKLVEWINSPEISPEKKFNMVAQYILAKPAAKVEVEKTKIKTPKFELHQVEGSEDEEDTQH